MSWFAWLRQLLFGRPPARDVSRLGSTGDDAVRVVEEIDVSGGPLKPEHRRLALRDHRLLPKAAPPVRIGRKRLFTRPDAKRLFGGTLRTQNRDIRDLLPDEEQLERLGLPVWHSEADLAAALGLELHQLRYFAVHRDRERWVHYITFAIPKRTGGERLIMAPKRKLKTLQRRLVDLLVARLPLSPHAHGFRKGRSIRTGAEPHVKRKIIVRIDLADFFPTVTWQRVRGLLLAYGYGFPVATALAVLMTEAERQPVDVDGVIYHVPVGTRYCVQGAPTSPGVCNAIARKLDNRLAGLARKFGFEYTRYADDLTFSGNSDRCQAVGLLHHARRIIQSEGFQVNEKKTRIQGRGGRQSVTGVVVNDTLGLSRKERRKIRAAIHRLGENPDPAARASIEGKLNYLAMLNPAQAEALRRKMK